MSITLDGSNGITTPMYNGAVSSNQVTPSVNMKNRLINSAMVIDQRNAGASVTPTDGAYTLDRYVTWASQSSKFTVQQNAGSVTTPIGFSKYLGVTSSSAYSVTSGDYFGIAQYIEGFNTSDLAWGTANAKTVTLSFQVYSSLTGTFGGTIQNSAFNRSYPFSYTISSANTWTTISITIAGDTTGTWIGATNGVGMRVLFSLGMGSTYTGTANTWTGANYLAPTGSQSVVGTNGATFYITAIQLEQGSSATSFDYRPYGTELNLCYRYFQKFLGYSANEAIPYYGLAGGGTTGVEGAFTLKQTMRTGPSVSVSGVYITEGVNGFTPTTYPIYGNGVDCVRMGFAGTSGLTSYRTYYVLSNNTSSYVLWSAEL